MPVQNVPICDALMKGAVNSMGEPIAEDYGEVLDRVWAHFWASPIGEQFLKTYLPDDVSFDVITQEYARRYGEVGEYGKFAPGVILSDRLQLVVGDLMEVKDPRLTLANPPQPAPKPTPLNEKQEHRAKINRLNAMKVDPDVSAIDLKNLRESSVEWQRAWNDCGKPEFNLGYVAPTVEQAPSDVIKFAHGLNETIANHGVPKLIAGFYTVYYGGDGYRYRAEEFNRLSDEAFKFNLVR